MRVRVEVREVSANGEELDYSPLFHEDMDVEDDGLFHLVMGLHRHLKAFINNEYLEGVCRNGLLGQQEDLKCK